MLHSGKIPLFLPYDEFNAVSQLIESPVLPDCTHFDKSSTGACFIGQEQGDCQVRRISRFSGGDGTS